MPTKKFTKRSLDTLYRKYNRPSFIHPDPLEFLHDYDNPEDREIVALVASGLAYGRVRQILKSVSSALEIMGSPLEYVGDGDKARMKRDFKNFKHRFTTGAEMADLLHGAGAAIREYGSLGSCFASCLRPEEPTVKEALSRFTRRILAPSKKASSSLLPDPEKGSACKRMNLMLRWLVRRDSVDPGGWDQVDPSSLIVPLDTHMHRIALEHGLTKRKAADMRTALEITSAFSGFSPKDPVKYDFALTRPGIGGH